MKKTLAMRLLERHGMSYDTVHYTYDPQNLDVRHIAEENQLPLAHIYKTLVAKSDPSGPIVAVVPGDHILDLKALARVSGNKRVYLLPIPSLEPTTGYVRGGCCPIGMKKHFPVYIDQAAEDLGFVWVNAGIRGTLIKIDLADLISVSQGTIAKIAVRR